MEHGASIVVTGDVTIDWNIARSRKLGSEGSAWNVEDSVSAYGQRGGAALLAALIEEVAQGLPADGRWEVRQPGGRDDVLCPGDERFHHSYATWSLFPYGEADDHRREKRAWRVEEFLGLEDHPAATRVAPWQVVAGDDPAATLVVLDDAGLGFRLHTDLWPLAVRERGRHPWVVLKMARPLAQGELWSHLLREHAERLLVVMSIDDLRRMEVQVSRQLSWEQTAQDLAWEVVYNPLVNALSRSAHLLVSFGTAGAMLLSRPDTESEGADLSFPRCRLFFDPKEVEGTWQRRHRGGMIGYNTCLAAALARELMLAQPDLERGVQAGLAATRWLHRRGYGSRGTRADEAALRFPVKEAAGELARPAREFEVAVVQSPVRVLSEPPRRSGGRSWSILGDRFPGRLEEVAERVALEGVEWALPGVPLGRFGKLLTVDRREIESFRSIASLLGEYCQQGQSGIPVSLAVFGAPGSGKSFGVTEVAESVLPGKVERLTFNLSQLGHADELLGAFHQVRDKVLAGKIPLVFWDEFDTAFDGMPLGWLRHFLAPMQDGRFQHGQVTHSIGRSIFVFAGGTSERLETFGQDIVKPTEFIRLKGPDFVSRLKGYVNILGPNRRLVAGTEVSDTHFLLRRAILLRSLLYRQHRHLFQQEDGKEILQIDPGVLRGFLQTREYLHGARSLEAVVKMSLLHGKTRFERSSLPAEAQLELHVDARDLLALVRKVEFKGEQLERLAAAAHAVYQKGLKRRGQTTDSAERAYTDLPLDEQEQNRASVREIANKLAHVGYVMLPARGEAVPFNFPERDLDQLAELEHDRWLKLKLADGWRWAERTDKARRLHRALILWRELSEEEKAQRFTAAELQAIGPGEIPEDEKHKDRDLVRGIPEILAKNGFEVVKTRAEEQERK